MQVHGITLLLNDKQDEIPSRICPECQFYSQSESTNAKYMTIHDCIRKYMIVHEKYMNKYYEKHNRKIVYEHCT